MMYRPPVGAVAVIFVSGRSQDDAEGYAVAAEAMATAAANRDGYLGIASSRDAAGIGITVSWWRGQADALAWRDDPDHARIRERGRAIWYDWYQVTVATVDRAYNWQRTLPPVRLERTMTFDIREDDLSGEETRKLLALHLAGMRADSPPDNVHALDLTGLTASDVTVWTAWEGTRAAAVGALKMLPDGTAEVKSMRTHPDFLRQGAARAILETIIAAASARGVRRLSLETGSAPSFEPAVALYRRYGFRDGPSFSHYAAGGFSRFLHLDIDRA